MSAFAVAWISESGDLSGKIRGGLAASEHWIIPEMVQRRIEQLLETGLYGASLVDVCGELVCRGIEAAIAKGIIE